jgi:alpha-ribazole phosphatase
MAVLAWRHPRPIGAEGRCIGGRTDLPVDARKAKRLAHRIRAVARREGLVREAVCSPLERCRAVGRCLRRFGFRCRIDARLAECDFGHWDGRHWEVIARAEIDAWCADLDCYAPGGGETVAALLERVDAVRHHPPGPMLVTHGGWLSAALWRPTVDQPRPSATTWPAAPAYGVLVRMD